MKTVHYADIPCKSKEKGITYTHVKSLVTCSKCLGILNGSKVVKDKVKKIEEKADDKRRSTSDK